MSETEQSREFLDWKQARRSAFIQDVLTTFTRRPGDLMDFEEVRQKMDLSHVRYLDLQDIPLDQIAGSVGRYTDFNRAFLPRSDHLQQRWQRIDRLLSAGHDFPPIELYKVGQVYFVRDGNHRVSVARQRRFSSLSARVWEFETDVPLASNSDIDELLCESAHAAFLERTEFDRLCPDLHLELTEPGGYEDLLSEIEYYQQILSQIDGRDIPFDEAVVLWVDIRYLPIVEIICKRHVLEHFPGRTETDFYVWLCRNREELEARFGHHVPMEDAARDLIQRRGRTPFPVRQIGRTIGGALRAATAWLTSKWRASRRALDRRVGRKQ
jgi:hypothetical protein